MNDGYFPLPSNARRSQCRSCGQPVAWVLTNSGAPMPLDLATVEQRDGVTMALNHFATCPHGQAWSQQHRRVNAVKACPSCGRDLIERTNSKTGSTFLGCAGWPDCSHAEPLPESIKLRRQGQAGMFDEEGL